MTTIYDFIRRTLHLNVINLQLKLVLSLLSYFCIDKSKFPSRIKESFIQLSSVNLSSFSKRGPIKIRIEKLHLRNF